MLRKAYSIYCGQDPEERGEEVQGIEDEDKELEAKGEKMTPKKSSGKRKVRTGLASPWWRFATSNARSSARRAARPAAARLPAGLAVATTAAAQEAAAPLAARSRRSGWRVPEFFLLRLCNVLTFLPSQSEADRLKGWASGEW
jgi:hypothetical protein